MSAYSRTHEAAHLFTILAIGYRDRDGRVSIEEKDGDLTHLAFDHNNPAGAADTLRILLDRAYGHGYQAAMRAAALDNGAVS